MTDAALTGKIKDTLDEFIASLKAVYANALITVALYGSASSGEFCDKHSDVNLLIVLDNTELDNLSRISELILKRKFRKLRPLFFTQEYIESSLDVFPIEFLDMKENYRVLHGKDVLSGLEVDPKNLRFQCEQELKAKLIGLKNIYLRNTERDALRNALFKAFTSVTHIIRNLLRLKGVKPPYLKEDILKEISRQFAIDTANFTRILAVKKDDLKLSYKELDALFLAFTKDVEKIAAFVDKA